MEELPASLRARFVCPLTAAADFYDTASLIAALDAVITVDTAVAHVTGALGQRGLVLKPAAPEWRWLERDGCSIWYPTLRLAERNEAIGDAGPALRIGSQAAAAIIASA